MPQIIPPINWLCAVRGFMMRPAAKAPTMRGTRISRVRACTRTSTNSAPKANIVFASLPTLAPPVMSALPLYRPAVVLERLLAGTKLPVSSTAPSLSLSNAALRCAALAPGANASLVSTCWQASCTAEHALAVVTEPPDTGPGGSRVSPIATDTCSGGTASIAAAVWAITVYAPVPTSCAAISTRADPSASSLTRATAGDTCVG